MKKFLVLYHAPASAMEQMSKATPEQAKAGMDLWMKWKDSNKKGIVDLGMPLGNGKQLQKSSTSGAKSTIVGYSIVQSDSIESATKMMKDHPHFHTPGGSVEVFEFLPMPGM